MNRTAHRFFTTPAAWIAALILCGGGCHGGFKSEANATQISEDAKKSKPAMSAPSITKSDFGKTSDGIPVDLYTLTNAHGVVAKIMTFGATLTELHVPDKAGKNADVVLGFDNLPQYEKQSPYFGTTVGRVANRIAGGSFTLNGKEYKLAVNNGPNTLHGGIKGFNKAVWKAEVVRDAASPSLRFTHTSPDGDENFPGNMSLTVTYTLTDDNAVKIEYAATTDKPTLINLTNHSYFNLAGAGSGTVDDQVMAINADKYTPSNDVLIPTGELKDVKGTLFDFTKPTPIGARIDQVPGGGYDHNYVINGGGGKLAPTARIHDPKSGRVMEMQTTEPGVQFYTGNFLDGKVTGIGGPYTKHAAFCLEAQHFPDSIHHPEFPTTVLNPGEKYTQVTIYRFSVE